MVRRIKYRDFKTYYSDCKTVAGSYDANNKTVLVDLPARNFPREWARYPGTRNYFITPGGCVVSASGNDEVISDYVIEKNGDEVLLTKVVKPGSQRYNQVIDAVRELEHTDIGEVFLTDNQKKALEQHSRKRGKK